MTTKVILLVEDSAAAVYRLLNHLWRALIMLRLHLTGYTEDERFQGSFVLSEAKSKGAHQALLFTFHLGLL